MKGDNGIVVNSNLIGNKAGFSGSISGKQTIVDYGAQMIGNNGLFADGTCNYTNYENS